MNCGFWCTLKERGNERRKDFGTRRPAGADFCGPGVNSLSLLQKINSLPPAAIQKASNLRVRASSKRRRRTET